MRAPPRLTALTAAIALALAACGGDDPDTPADVEVDALDNDTDASDATGSDVAVDSDDDATDDEIGNEPLEIGIPTDTEPDAADTPDSVDERPLGAALSQAIAGAMYINAAEFPTAGIRVQTTGPADSVHVSLGESVVVATRTGGDHWLAEFDISSLGTGTHSVEAIARAGEAAEAAHADLVIGVDGLQFTDWEAVGNALTPRLHHIDDSLWLTWAEASTDPRHAWLQPLDGAARALGDRVRITPEDVDIVYVRTAVGDGAVGVLYQESAEPWANWFQIVDIEGNVLLDPIALDAAERTGMYGGDVAYNGDEFVAVFRDTAGSPGTSRIMWFSASADGTVTGPTQVAAANDSGARDFVAATMRFDIAPLGDRSLVTFVRDRYDSLLELEVPRSEGVIVDSVGGIVDAGLLPSPPQFGFHHEAHAFAAADSVFVLWTLNDLLSEETYPPFIIYGQRIDATLDRLPRALGTAAIEDEVGTRSEPYFIYHGSDFEGSVAWTDERCNAIGTPPCHIELYVRMVGSTMSPRRAEVIDHARFVAGTSQINGIGIDRNAILVWVDNRHGFGLLEPRPEIYFDTVWF